MNACWFKNTKNIWWNHGVYIQEWIDINITTITVLSQPEHRFSTFKAGVVSSAERVIHSQLHPLLLRQLFCSSCLSATVKFGLALTGHLKLRKSASYYFSIFFTPIYFSWKKYTDNFIHLWLYFLLTFKAKPWRILAEFEENIFFSLIFFFPSHYSYCSTIVLFPPPSFTSEMTSALCNCTECTSQQRGQQSAWNNTRNPFLCFQFIYETQINQRECKVHKIYAIKALSWRVFAGIPYSQL